MSSPYHQLTALSNDAIVDILLFCTNDLKSVMNFASSCSEFHNIITQSSSADRFWLVILMNLINEKQSKGFKSSTLSILNRTPKHKSKSLINIIRTQTIYKRKHDIINQYSKMETWNKFRFMSKFTTDPVLSKLLAPFIIDSLKYSPSNMIKDVYDNSPIHFMRITNSQFHNCMSLQDSIDVLFKKPNAHLELDIKNRTMSSYLYDYWKDTRNPFSAMNYQLYHTRFSYVYKFCNSVENVILFLKFLYLELPNRYTAEDSVMQTGYEQEKETKGIFKKQLRFLKDTYPQNTVFANGVLEFEKMLYDDDGNVV